jgi:hypothetical protein
MPPYEKIERGHAKGPRRNSVLFRSRKAGQNKKGEEKRMMIALKVTRTMVS